VSSFQVWKCTSASPSGPVATCPIITSLCTYFLAWFTKRWDFKAYYNGIITPHALDDDCSSITWAMVVVLVTVPSKTDLTSSWLSRISNPIILHWWSFSGWVRIGSVALSRMNPLSTGHGNLPLFPEWAWEVPQPQRSFAILVPADFVSRYLFSFLAAASARLIHLQITCWHRFRLILLALYALIWPLISRLFLG